jgi:hypothetical protein
MLKTTNSIPYFAKLPPFDSSPTGSHLPAFSALVGVPANESATADINH